MDLTFILDFYFYLFYFFFDFYFILIFIFIFIILDLGKECDVMSHMMVTPVTNWSHIPQLQVTQSYNIESSETDNII